MSVTRTDLRFVGEKQYIAEGTTARGKRNREGVFHVMEKREVGPFLMERFMVSNCFQRVEPRTNRVRDIEDFQTLPTPTMEKYHPRNQLIHSVPRYLMMTYNPTRAPDAMIGKSKASSEETNSGISSSSSFSASLPNFFCWDYLSEGKV